MSAQYLYDGALSPQTADYIHDMMKRYPYPLELSAFPGKRMPKMPEYPLIREGCMGEPYASTSAMWGLVHKDFSNQSAGCFLFLYSPAEKKMVEEAVPDLIVNADPFKTVIA
jgi:hypothetical protein